MNRQCRTVAIETEHDGWVDVDGCWESYGNAGFFEAVLKHAVEQAASSFIFRGCIKVQTRDEFDQRHGEPIFVVGLSMKAQILNPRLDTDKIADNVSVAPKRNLLTKFWGLFS